MATSGSNESDQAEIEHALESPHIQPVSSRRKGRKRSANGDIDQRLTQKRRMDHESSSSTSGTTSLGAKRTASEEIMDRSTSRPAANGEGDEGKLDAEDTPIDDGEGAEIPLPDQMAPLAESMVDENGKPLSKNQQKKRRKQAEWEAKREDRKMIRKEKLLAKRERKKEAREQAVAAGEPAAPPPKPEHHPRIQLPVTFLIDCDFDNLMSDKERKSLASQITRSYSDARKSTYQPHLAISSFGGELKTRFDTILTHYKSWKPIRFLDEDFVAAGEQARKWMSDETLKNQLAGSFSPLATEGSDAINDLQSEGEIVYLTSESPYTLTALKPYSTYIIGGLVDKNREKGICYRRAAERGVKTAKLPIGEFMEMSSRKVLATNHVNEIMLKWLECGDWGEAFMQVIPKRKGGKLREEGGKDGDEDAEAEEDDEDGVADVDGNGAKAPSMEEAVTNGGAKDQRDEMAIEDAKV